MALAGSASSDDRRLRGLAGAGQRVWYDVVKGGGLRAVEYPPPYLPPQRRGSETSESYEARTGPLRREHDLDLARAEDDNRARLQAILNAARWCFDAGHRPESLQLLEVARSEYGVSLLDPPAFADIADLAREATLRRGHRQHYGAGQ